MLVRIFLLSFFFVQSEDVDGNRLLFDVVLLLLLLLLLLVVGIVRISMAEGVGERMGLILIVGYRRCR